MLRALLPCVAGYSRYRIKSWLIFDSVGLLGWILVVLAIGYTAHWAVFSHGGVIALLLDTLATVMMLIVSWRLWRNYSSIKEAPSTVSDASQRP
jgi:membrane protein DedA with SNARE-associated domain